MLDYFKELHQVNQDSYESDLILWNNQDITIEGESLFLKRWSENGIYYIQDILYENGNFLNRRYNMSTNFLNFFQILASIPSNLKSKAASTLRPKNSINRRYNMSTNFENFFQILASIPPNLKSKVASMLRPKNSVLDNSDFFDFSIEKSVFLSKMKCKDYYLLFQEKSGYTYSHQVLGPTLLWHRR